MNLKIGDFLLDEKGEEFEIAGFEMIHFSDKIFPGWYTKVGCASLKGDKTDIGSYVTKKRMCAGNESEVRKESGGIMFKINFELQQPDKIVPWGGQQPSLHWFGLTDGLLWINAGEGTIYEYSDAAIKHWELNEPAYNDYQLSRFLEDFSETFKYIGIPIPAGLYEHIEKFSHLAGEWNELHWDLPDEEFEKFYDDEYGVLIQWYYDRVIDSGHLIGGPDIGFFRYEDKIKILWNSDYMLDNGKSIWKTPKGVYELEFDDFVNEVERFYHDFYNRMDEQVKKAVLKDWKEVELDKKRLMEENEQRKEEFNQKINMLKQGDMKQMNVVLDEDNQAGWEKILFLYDKMISELGNGQEKS